jgi:hypothetical protein
MFANLTSGGKKIKAGFDKPDDKGRFVETNIPPGMLNRIAKGKSVNFVSGIVDKETVKSFVSGIKTDLVSLELTDETG